MNQNFYHRLKQLQANKDNMPIKLYYHKLQVLRSEIKQSIFNDSHTDYQCATTLTTFKNMLDIN